MSSNSTTSLVAWSTTNGIVIDPRIEVVKLDTAGGPFIDTEENTPRTTLDKYSMYQNLFTP